MSRDFPDPASIASLSVEEIESSVELLLDERVSEDSKARFLTALGDRGETAGELSGFARVLLSRAVRPVFERTGGGPLLELCGTGGDRAGFLNISTAAMFVAAGSGARVVKHGNRALTSRCGSADVLEALGIAIHLEPARVGEVLERAGCVFMLASDFHPAFAAVAPLRKKLAERGRKTIFNLLGPLLNPAAPDYQLTGIYRPEMLPFYAEAIRLLGRRKAWAVHGSGLHPGEGVDELSVTGPSRVVEVSLENASSREFTIDPRNLGLEPVTDTASLIGGDAATNARRIESILRGGENGAARDMILLNASAAIHLAGIGSTLCESFEIASRSIDSGAAFDALFVLREVGGVG